MGKKSDIYTYIKSEISKRGLPPTIREIGDRFNIASTNGVRYFLEKLEEEGFIKREPRTARGIRLVQRESAEAARSVPLLGRVPAGGPDFSEENLEGHVLVDVRMARGDGLFAVRVQGDSMINAGINDGDIAVVKTNPHPPVGEIVIALIDDEVTLKRLVKKGRELILKPENDRYEDIYLSSLKDKNISIIGTLEAIVRSY